MKNTAALIPFLTLAACSPIHPNVGHWAGTVTPSTTGPTCEKSRATLDVAKDGKVIFAPNEGTWTLTGTVATKGIIVATRSQPGADKKPFVTRLDAQLTSAAITGTYATPRCIYAVNLLPTQR